LSRIYPSNNKFVMSLFEANIFHDTLNLYRYYIQRWMRRKLRGGHSWFRHFTGKQVRKHLTLKHARITGTRVNAVRVRPRAAGAVAIPPPGGSGWNRHISHSYSINICKYCKIKDFNHTNIAIIKTPIHVKLIYKRIKLK